MQLNRSRMRWGVLLIAVGFAFGVSIEWLGDRMFPFMMVPMLVGTCLISFTKCPACKWPIFKKKPARKDSQVTYWSPSIPKNCMNCGVALE